LGIENATSIVITPPITDIGFWSSLATIILVGVLIWQVIILRKQISNSEETTRLAHGPMIYPRYQGVATYGPYLWFENIGTGSAVEVHITLSDPDTGKELEKFDVFALKPDELRSTRISLMKQNKVKIKGTYQNILRKKFEIDTIFDYQKRKTEDSSNKDSK